MGKTRLGDQMRFISELEKLKVVYRQNGILGGGRQENSAEHSWHIAIMDNLQPILNHFLTDNRNIKRKLVTKSQIIDKKKFIRDFSEELWEYACAIIDESVGKGLYIDE